VSPADYASEYSASEVILGEIESDPIWERNLNEIEEVTTWNFLRNDEDGGFLIERV
jgi:hypothetical protein